MHGKLQAIALAAFVALMLYAAFANMVFSFRHPWVTDTERLIHFFDALTFEKVSYDEMRRR